MSYPILYSSTETNFDNNGLGILGDCAHCEVVEEANGMFELSMEYPMDGIHFDDISDRSIIKAKPDQFREPQLFRVYAKSKPMSGIVTILAEHISYDLSGIPVSPFTAEGAVLSLQALKANAVVECPFDFWTDRPTNGRFVVSTPASLRSRLGGVDGSILDVFGGEYEFDNYTVKLHTSRGLNRGVSIRYGKNLTDIKQDENCSSVATGVYPYWVNPEDGTVTELPEKIVSTPGTYNFVKIRTLDVTQSFETAPTEEQLRTFTQNYIQNNNIGVPKVSLTVSFAQLEQSEEYKHLNLLERVTLFDTVNVEFPALKVSATAKAVKLVYDVILDRVKSISLGDVKTNIADTIANQQTAIQNVPTKSDIFSAQELATSWLTNGRGYKVERRDENGNTIDTLYLDTPDIENAQNILRIGQSGIGFSHNGVDGPYVNAWTIDGNFIANFIRSGKISSFDGNLMFDLDNNEIISHGLDLNEKEIMTTIARGMFSIARKGVGADGSELYVDSLMISSQETSDNIFSSREFMISGESGTFVGTPSSNTNFYGSRFNFIDSDGWKETFWKDNGDGTYTMMAR